MSSFTSSSRRNGAGMFKERSFQSLLVALVLCVVVVGFRFQMDTELVYYQGVPKGFWQNKVFADPVYDIVMMGDSRVNNGLAPEEMTTILEDYRILNFGFFRGGLNPEMYHAAEEKLNPSGYRTIILGITPQSLTPEGLANEHYQSFRSDWDIFTTPAEYPNITQPITRVEIRFWLTKEYPVPFFYQDPRTDGWIASYLEPPFYQGWIDAFKEIFIDNRVTDENVNAMITQVGTWHDDDICVYAFRFPAIDEIMQIEDELSGFDEVEVRQRLEANGAIWIDVDPQAYETYDGSHLHMDSARELSRDVATVIANNPCDR